MICPSPLKPGDQVAVIAPASPIQKGQEDLLQQGISHLKNWGLQVQYPHNLLNSAESYLAASDAIRFQWFQDAWKNPDIKAIFTTRGGYGSSRLLEQFSNIEKLDHPKWLIGFSDITSLHLYFNQILDIVTLHGPGIATQQFLTSSINQSSMQQRLFDSPAISFTVEPLKTGPEAEGIVIGGCLSLIASAAGTLISTTSHKGILIIEEVGEDLYKIDRMLTQLRLSGTFKQLQGIILGEFKGCGESDKLELFFKNYFKHDPFGVWKGLPIGHGEHNQSIALGLKYKLAQDQLVHLNKEGT